MPKIRYNVRRKGFTIIELLIVISIIMLLTGILLPCLTGVKERALELFAMEVDVNDEGIFRLEITLPSEKRRQDDIYLINLNYPRNCHVTLKKPLSIRDENGKNRRPGLY